MYPSTTSFEFVPFDLYRDVHKAIRVGLFDVTAAAGRVDPDDEAARVELAARVRDLVDFLVFHATHEDGHLDGPIARILPEEAAGINADHASLEAEMANLVALGDRVFDGPTATARADAHELYLALARFTSRYLAHQDVEERTVMPALFASYGFDGVVELHEAILAGISPEDMGASLVKMLPAMNVDDRVEMLAGMRMSAPPEAFQGTVALAADLLAPADFDALLTRLESDTVGAEA